MDTLQGVSVQRQFTPVAWLMLATLCTAISDWQELGYNIFPSLVLFWFVGNHCGFRRTELHHSG
jgi:hypothetical protein